ncbi:hypothetical protein L7F22_026789 [Adiantum nelumboides]|nr:hypothetical protein [Adiantum nelumboides]
MNRTPTAVVHDMTPEEKFTRKKPDVSHFKVFGCIAYVHVSDELRTKLDPKAKKCVFIGYSVEQKGYRCYNPIMRQVRVSRDVVFDEMATWYADVKDGIGADVKKSVAENLDVQSQVLSGPQGSPTSSHVANAWSEILRKEESPASSINVSRKGKEKVDEGMRMPNVVVGHDDVDGHSSGSEHSLDEELGIPSVRTPGGDALKDVQHIKALLRKQFDMKDLGELRYFLGIEMIRNEGSIWLSHKKYGLDMLMKYCMADYSGQLYIHDDLTARFELCNWIGEAVYAASKEATFGCRETYTKSYIVQLFDVTLEECNGVLKFVIKLDECKLVKETKVERVTITLMNRALDASIGPDDPQNFSVQSEHNIFLLAMFKEIAILQNSFRELTDQIINLDLCMLVAKLTWNQQFEVAVLDAQLSPVLTSESTSLIEVVDWFQRVNMETVKVIFLAYNENLVGLNVKRKRCYLANSVHGFHGNVRRSVQKLDAKWEALTQDSVLDNMLILSCTVSKQDDAHSC